MAEPDYNEGEKAVLRQSRLMKELLEHEGWKTFVQLLEAQLVTREMFLSAPMHTLTAGSFAGMDFASKSAQLESIKGAIIGLKLARELPGLIIGQAQEIVNDHSQGEAE